MKRAALHRGGAEAAAAVAVAEGWSPVATARSPAATERALRLAELSGSPLLIDEALDLLAVLQMGEGDLFAAGTTIDRRLQILAAVPVSALSGFEHYDSLHMACQLNLAMGRLEPARRYADAITVLPFFREERHLGLGRRLSVDALAGDFGPAVAHAELFERDWRRSGRPVVGNLAVGAYAAAMVFGMLDDEEGRDRWIKITRALLSDPERLHTVNNAWRVVFDGLLALHRDDLPGAVSVLSSYPGAGPAGRTTADSLWVSWFAAAWAETGVLTGDPDATTRLVKGRELCRSQLDRAHHGASGDRPARRKGRRSGPDHRPIQHARMRLPGGSHA